MKRGNLVLVGALAIAAIALIVITGLRPDHSSEPGLTARNNDPAASQAAANGLGRDSTAADGTGSTFSPSATITASTASSSTSASSSSADADTDSLADTASSDASAGSDDPDQQVTADGNTSENGDTENAGQVLSKEVYEIIDEVQKRFEEGQWMEGANELNALYEDYDALNDFEKATVLNFYTNLLLANNMYPEAVNAFEAILEIETLRPDIRQRAILALGQLSQVGGELESAVSYYNQYLESTDAPNPSVLLRLANSHYELGQYREAIAPLTEHIEMLIATNEEVERNKLGLLNVLALESGDWQSAATVNEMMIEAYNDPRDWQNLAEIYQQLGDTEKHQQLMSDAASLGYVDDTGTWLEPTAQ